MDVPERRPGGLWVGRVMAGGLALIGGVALALALRTSTKATPESQRVPLMDTEAQGPFEYGAWAKVLQTRVDERGMVDYVGLKAEPEELDAFLAEVAAYSPDTHAAMFTTEDEALAYWINAYNAWAMKIVADSYPVKSIQDIGEKRGAAFDERVCELGGRRLSLNDIDHGIVRERFGEPRVHFALNCASLGCPPLPREPFLPESLDQQLEAAATDLFARSWYVRMLDDGKTVGVSSILQWYRDDFLKWLEREKSGGQIRDYVMRYAPEPVRKALEKGAHIEFIDYDWRLTDQAAPWGKLDRK